MTPILAAENLGRVLPGEVPVTLVQDVTLEIGRGEFVAIMGPSGSGKSSLLYLLGLLDTPTSGRVWLDGRDTSSFGEDELAATRLEKLGFVFQFHFLLAEFTVLDNVLLPMRRLGARSEEEARQRAADLLRSLAWAIRAASARINCPAASASASPSLGPWPTTRRWCWPMSQPAIWTVAPQPTSGKSCMT